MRNGSCALSRPSSGTARSTCPQSYGFRISSAAQILESKPCTNVPIRCLLCPTDIYHWRYNMWQNLNDRHPDWRTILQSTGSKDVQAFSQEILISSEEESQIGIPSNKHNDWSTVMRELADRRCMSCRPQIEDCHGASPRSGRTAKAPPGAYGAPIHLHYNHPLPNTSKSNLFQSDIFS